MSSFVLSSELYLRLHHFRFDIGENNDEKSTNDCRLYERKVF